MSDDVIRPLLPEATNSPIQSPIQAPEPPNRVQKPTDQAPGPSNQTPEMMDETQTGLSPDHFLDQHPDLLNTGQHVYVKPEPGHVGDPPAIASLETLLRDSLQQSAKWMAMEHSQQAMDWRPIDEIEAEYRARLEDIRFKLQVQRGPMDMPRNIAPQSLMLPSVDDNTQDPGSSDPSSKPSTQPSTQDYSSGFSSLLPSSQSSLESNDPFNFFNDFPTTFPDLNNHPVMAGPLDCPQPAANAQAPAPTPIPTGPAHNLHPPLPPMLDAILDQPGPSRRPQELAQLAQDARRQTDTSPWDELLSFQWSSPSNGPSQTGNGHQ